MTLLDTNAVSLFLRRETRTRVPELHDAVEEIIRSGAAISVITLYEQRRGLEELLLRGAARRKLVAFEKLVASVEVLSLDGGGWELAARWWAVGRAHKPAIVFSESDLLVASTASFHGRTLATCDTRLASNLAAISVPVDVRVLPVGPRAIDR